MTVTTTTLALRRASLTAGGRLRADFLLATIAVPVVIYGLMPQLCGIRGRLLRPSMSS